MVSNTPTSDTTSHTTRALLLCGVVAGPLYMILSLGQAFTRAGFDITRHALSLLTNGDLGWLQVANFIITGLLIIASAVGMRPALSSGRGRTLAPMLIGIYGLSFVGAGLFKPDPALGFPVGTPADAMTIGTTGMVHFAVGGIGFLAIIVACFIFARRFSGLGQGAWSLFSMITGVAFLLAFGALASGAGKSRTFIGFLLGVSLVWAWLSLVCLKLRSELGHVPV